MEDIKNSSFNNSQAAARVGLVGGLMFIGFYIVTALTGWVTEKSTLVSVVNVVVVSGIFTFVAHKTITTQRDVGQNGIITFGEGFGSTMIAVLVSVAMSTLFAYVFMKFIDPSIVETMKEMSLQALENADLQGADIDEAAEMMDKIISPGLIASSEFFMRLVWGAVIGVLVAAILPKNKPQID
jgi:putative flippase GtrA